MQETTAQITDKLKAESLHGEVKEKISIMSEWIGRINGLLQNIKPISISVKASAKEDTILKLFENAVDKENFAAQILSLRNSASVLELLDYRNWYNIDLFLSDALLTNRTFYQLTSEEQSLVCYAPVLCAVFALYTTAGNDAPRVLFLDSQSELLKNLINILGL
jgi:hypothetical protein